MMADGRGGGAPRAGPAERAAAAVPQPAGRGFRWMTLALLAISTAALLVIAVQLFLLLGRVQASGDSAAIKGDVAALKTELAGFRSESAKALTAVQKSAAEISDRVNTTNLAIQNLSVGLAKKP